jgi:hypothetical protein
LLVFLVKKSKSLGSYGGGDITEEERLWSAWYDGEADNALYMLFEQWNDVIKFHAIVFMIVIQLAAHLYI